MEEEPHNQSKTGVSFHFEFLQDFLASLVTFQLKISGTNK